MKPNDAADGNKGDSLPAFEELVALHQTDPAAFERLRSTLLGKAVSNAPEQHRDALSKLVEKLNAIHASAPSGQAAAEEAFRLMQQSVARLGETVDQAREEIAKLQTTVILKQISLNAAIAPLPAARRMRRHRDRM